MLIKWSAPAFIRIRLASLGLSLGHQTLQSFTACMSSATRCKLYQQGSRAVTGLEAALSCGGLQHKADLIAVPQDDMKTAGFQIAHGLLLDLSFAAGTMQVDDAKNAEVYGADATALRILHGGIEPPREMQPLYGRLNSVVSTVERVTPPARVSASLERFSTGIDPERRIVLKDGTVLYGDPSLRGTSRKHK
jgi:lipid-binding SYLF domain-containing protein